MWDVHWYRPRIGIGPIFAVIGQYRYWQIKLTLTGGSSQYLSVVEKHALCAGYVGVLGNLQPTKL